MPWKKFEFLMEGANLKYLKVPLPRSAGSPAGLVLMQGYQPA